MSTRFPARAAFVSIMIALIALSGCRRDDAGGNPWGLDSGTLDAQMDSGLTDPDAEVEDARDTRDTRDGQDARPDGPLPEAFYGCLPETDLHPPERPRGEPPEAVTLEFLWRAQPPPDQPGFDNIFGVSRLSQPSIHRSQNDGTPLIAASSEGRLGERSAFFRWGFGTRTGQSDLFVGIGYDFELILPDAPPPTIYDASAFGMLAAAHDTRDGWEDEYLMTNWMAGRAEESVSVGRRQEDFATLEEPGTGRLLLMPGGLYLGSWGTGQLVGLAPELFDYEADVQDAPRYKWVASTDHLWVGESTEPKIKHLAGPNPLEAVVLMEGEDGLNQWVGVDRCGQTREILTAGFMLPEILWMGDAYLVLARMNAVRIGYRPLVVRNGEVVQQGGFGCRDIVERATDEWACLRQTQTGYEVVTFGRDMELREAMDLPELEDAYWRTVNLELAGRGGALIVRGIVGRNDQEPAFGVAVLEANGQDSLATIVEAFPGDIDESPSSSRRVGVLSPDGVYAFTTPQSVYAVQTHLFGLADTRHPRAKWAGNESRGYVEPDAP